MVKLWENTKKKRKKKEKKKGKKKEMKKERKIEIKWFTIPVFSVRVRHKLYLVLFVSSGPLAIH